jgi:hypothetical protein
MAPGGGAVAWAGGWSLNSNCSYSSSLRRRSAMVSIHAPQLGQNSSSTTVVPQLPHTCLAIPGRYCATAMPLLVIREAERWTPLSLAGGLLLLAALVGLIYHLSRRDR